MPELTATVLMIEDDADGRQSLTDALADAGYRVVAAATADEGLRLFHEQPCDVVITDVRLPDKDGFQVLHLLKQQDPAIPVLLITAYGNVASAVEALKSGAYDYLLKPLDLNEIQAKVARALETRRLRSEVASLKKSIRFSLGAVTAHSSVMIALLNQVRSVAPTQATVLVLGESGAGKELIARGLHVESRRSEGPFIAVNCGAFSESLLESELFGHEKGSFTGASARHEGAFEQAHGGTLFLDEIGSAPLSVQVRLLRALELKEIVRVGGKARLAMDVRIVAASNQDLHELVGDGRFRQDLLYRLQVVTLRVPPLRERSEDIRPLTDVFVANACREHGRHLDFIAQDFYDALERYHWPGNVRELKNAVESAVILAAGRSLSAADLQLGHTSAALSKTPALPAGLPFAELEKQIFLQALTRHKGSRVLVSNELGISTRTIQRKIKEYDLPF